MMSRQLRGIRRSDLGCLTPDTKVSAKRQTPRPSDREVIERTRQLMEQSIKFVSQPFYESRNAIDLIHAKRPVSLDQPRDGANAKTGRTFISALVAQPPSVLRKSGTGSN